MSAHPAKEASSLEAISNPPKPRPHLLSLPRSVALGLYKHHALDHAATMSFYFFLGSIPLLVFGGLLLGRILQIGGADSFGGGSLFRAMPPAAADLLREQLKEIAETRITSMAPLSLFGFLWLTSNGFHNLMDVFELSINAKPRAWWKQRLIALLWVAVSVATAGIATGFLLLSNGVLQGFGHADLPAVLHYGGQLLAHQWHLWGAVLVFVGLSTTGLAFFYRFAVVHPAGTRRWVWPGTIIAHVLWAIVTWLFGTYVRTIGDYAVYYGSLATVVVALLWLYLTSLALLVGAELNAQLEGVRIVDSPH